MTLALPERTAPAPAPVAHRGGALSLAHMTPADAWKFSEALSGASLLPRDYRGNPGSVLWAMEYGRALGLDVVTTITTIHVINGKPTQSADLMLSRAREAGHRVRIKSERERCVVSIVRHDDPDDENVIEWTLDDARTAKLLPGKPDSNWAKYPRAMLRARAIAECVRAACPEVLHGAIYTAEELGAQVDDAGLPVSVEVQQLRRAEPGPDQWSTPAPAPVVEAAPEYDRRDFLAEAMEVTDPDLIAGIIADAVEAGALSAYVSMLDDIREAKQAPDVVAVRKLYEAVVEAGAPSEHRARIAHIGQGKPAGPPKQAAAAAQAVVEEVQAEHAAALADMYAAAHAAGMESRDEADKAFASHYQCQPAAATAVQLREQAATLRQIAGAL